MTASEWTVAMGVLPAVGTLLIIAAGVKLVLSFVVGSSRW